MLKRLTEYQMNEWKAYYSIEPFGEGRADWRQGVTSMLYANANRPCNKKGRPTTKAYKVEDFMLGIKEKKQRQQTQEEIANTLCMLS